MARYKHKFSNLQTAKDNTSNDSSSAHHSVTSLNKGPSSSGSASSSSSSSSSSSTSSVATHELPDLHPRKRVAPQQAIDRFWKNFTSKTPGKATTVIPKSQYAAQVVTKKTTHAALSQATTTTTGTSYEEAAAICKAKVEKIVKECRRVNKKYRDPHFDIEADLKMRDFDCLRSLHSCKDDEDCSPPGSSLQPQSAKRVPEIFDRPKFYVQGVSSNDVRQGRDGDCWLMSALCALSNKKGLIERLCVARDEAVGVYGFVFYRDGDWISEIIDDFLYLTKPDYDEGYVDRILFDELERNNTEEAYRRVYQSNSSSLYFAQCEHPQETWLPLLEKAYAKAHGDFASIEGGFTAEGVEDLSGGVTSEMLTTDILDKEYFWKEELLNVNKDFLFGCGTGIWGNTRWRERKGIVELHAYSIQRAVEIDGKRLLRLRNPWGKGEWKGAWSDGSKEWTAEWLQKLNHRFGDDGDFWISYEDLLRKYQSFERTRLFGNDWGVSQIWTTVTVPWMTDYSETYFTLSITRPGPVVIVLAQLDSRYFCGLEGQYMFKLAFRVHKKGHEDYLVRSSAHYRMHRSVNVELDLEEGEYEIRIKVNAERDDDVLPIEGVVQRSAKSRRTKLTRIGLAYDLAHGKGRIEETAQETAARKQHEKKQKDEHRQEIKKAMMKQREDEQYGKVKEWKREQRKLMRRKEKAKAKKAASEAKRAEYLAKKAEKTATPEAAQENDDTAAAKDDDAAEAKTDNGNNAKDTPETQKDEEEGTTDTTKEVEDAEENASEDSDDPPCESESDDDLESIASLSTLSEREIDMQVEASRAQETDEECDESEGDDDDESDPWNAVAVVGLRVFHKMLDGDDGNKDVIKISVERPNPWIDQDKAGGGEDENAVGGDISRRLDVDDSAKDATLEGELKDRKKSILTNNRKR